MLVVFFNEELQKKILKLLSSRHVIFCLTMCNRKQDLVFSFCLPNQPTKLLLCTTTARVVIPHFMRRQLLCEKITISGGQVYIWLQSRYSPAQNYFFLLKVSSCNPHGNIKKFFGQKTIWARVIRKCFKLFLGN